MPGIWGDGQRGGIFGAKVDPRLLQAALEQRAEAERQRQAQSRIAGAFEAAGGMQEPSQALYAAKHQRAMDALGNRPPEGPGFWETVTSMGPGIRSGLKAIADPRTSPFSPAAVARMFFDPTGEANYQGEAGKQLVEPFTQFGDPNVDPAKQGADLALAVMGMSSVVPAEANQLRMGIKAYHASPHKFDRFDASRIGTGQGAQTFGHGIYAAENPAVSGRGGSYDREFTAKKLGQSDTTPQQEYILNRMGEGASDLDILKGLAQRGGTDFEQAQAMLDKVKAAKANIYDVDIAADPEHFLDWDKPLSEQKLKPEAIDPVLSRAVPSPKNPQPYTLEELSGMGATGRDLYDRLSWASGKPGAFPEINVATPADASVALREAGIPGIRYLDQGSRVPNNNFTLISPKQGQIDEWTVINRQTGKHELFNDEAAARNYYERQTSPTRNYVVFDDKLISILKKYGLPITAAGLAALSQLHPQEAQAAQQKGKR